MLGKISLNWGKNIHFIGIGGISMSGLAEILLRDGFVVSGSDDVETEITARLSGLGVNFLGPNAAANISKEIDLIVYTAAVKPDNAEFVAAKEADIPLIERAAFIGKLLENYEPVCIAGTHGKTTTSSMIAEVVQAAGLDPTVQIGGHMLKGGMNYRVGDSKIFVLESCEYGNQFRHWQPHIGVILNIDADHLDFFGNFENLVEAFAKFAANIRPDGALIIRAGIPGFEKVVENAACEIFTFSTGSSQQPVEKNYWPKNIEYNSGKPSFDVMCGENFLARVNLPLPGEYNMLNALACFAAASRLQISPQVTARALSGVQGAKRRFEVKGTYNGATIVDDYAHHPTEIKNCLAAARQTAKDSRIICLFQPHTYTRTKNLLHEFADSFYDADEIILLPIYAAREPFDPEISSKMLCDLIKSTKKDVIFAKNFAEANNYLKKTLRPGDLIITMGAGDVFEIGDDLLQA